MARKGILTTDGAARPARSSDRSAPRGTVGALQSSLSRLQESAVQELDPGVIHDAGVVDRLGVDEAADSALSESLKTYGQQVPVLVRPRDGQPGHYDIVYGRRRVIALRGLGLPVKAMVRHLDDRALVLAQGQENNARQDLSFIEKASFAAQLEALDYDRQTIADALSIDLPMVSRMLKVGRAFDMDLLRQIGSAPGIGRDRWLKLVQAMKQPGMADRVINRSPTLAMVETSDARFEQVLAWATMQKVPDAARAAAPPARSVTAGDGTPLARVRRTDKGVTLAIPAKDTAGFAQWVDAHAETLLTELHDRWKTERTED